MSSSFAAAPPPCLLHVELVGAAGRGATVATLPHTQAVAECTPHSSNGNRAGALAHRKQQFKIRAVHANERPNFALEETPTAPIASA